MQALDITDTRTLEDLCINTIYAFLLTGKLSPQTQTFEITSCTSRDLSVQPDYAGMIATLNQWSRQCDLVLAEVMGRIRDVKVAAQNRKLAEEEYEREVEVAGNGGIGEKGNEGKEKDIPVQEITMHDVEEEIVQNMMTGRESPTGRKRKLVTTILKFPRSCTNKYVGKTMIALFQGKIH